MAKAPTKAQREKWGRVRELGCMLCKKPAQIHHALTGGGGRKDHDKVIPLCFDHHIGACGIHHLGRKKWQASYGSELDMLETVENMLANST